MAGNNEQAYESIRVHYEQNVQYEWERLKRNRLEFYINSRIIEESLPQSSCDILDCGGGPGRYTIHFSQLGHRVTLLDLSDANIKFAVEYAAGQGIAMHGAEVGNALDLSIFPDNHFDAVLELGPFYHLLELEHRYKALEEAKRVTKNGGIIAIAFLNRITWPRFLANTEPNRLSQDSKKITTLLENGVLEMQGGGLLPHTHTVLPNEIRPFIESAGLTVLRLASSQSFLGNLWAGPAQTISRSWESWQDIAYRFCEIPEYLGCGEHFLCIAKKD